MAGQTSDPDVLFSSTCVFSFNPLLERRRYIFTSFNEIQRRITLSFLLNRRGVSSFFIPLTREYFAFTTKQTDLIFPFSVKFHPLLAQSQTLPSKFLWAVSLSIIYQPAVAENQEISL